MGDKVLDIILKVIPIVISVISLLYARRSNIIAKKSKNTQLLDERKNVKHCADILYKECKNRIDIINKNNDTLKVFIKENNIDLDKPRDEKYYLQNTDLVCEYDNLIKKVIGEIGSINISITKKYSNINKDINSEDIMWYILVLEPFKEEFEFTRCIFKKKIADASTHVNRVIDLQPAKQVHSQIVYDVNKYPLDISKLHINGDYLLSIGYKGRVIGDILNKCLKAVVDNQVVNESERLKTYVDKHFTNDNTYKNLLLVTRGTPGCGKSTYVNELNTEDNKYVIASDELRYIFACDYSNDEDVNKYVWSFIRQSLDYRLFNNKLTVLDSTGDLRSIREYHTLCNLYNFKLVVLDFTEVPLNTCLVRNAQRNRKVPENYITKKYNLLLKENIDLSDVEVVDMSKNKLSIISLVKELQDKFITRS